MAALCVPLMVFQQIRGVLYVDGTEAQARSEPAQLERLSAGLGLSPWRWNPTTNAAVGFPVRTRCPVSPLVGFAAAATHKNHHAEKDCQNRTNHPQSV